MLRNMGGGHQGGERYFIVGSFKDAEETVFDPPSWYATTYYFFDDFSVWLCDTLELAEIDLQPQLQHPHVPVVESQPLVIPSLLSAFGNNIWHIGNLPGNSEVTVYNALGQMVYQSRNYRQELSTHDLAAGMYFYEISPPQRQVQSGKLVIIR